MDPPIPSSASIAGRCLNALRNASCTVQTCHCRGTQSRSFGVLWSFGALRCARSKWPRWDGPQDDGMDVVTATWYLIHSTPSYRQSAAQPHQPLVKWTSALTDLLDSARLGAPNSPIFLLWHVEAQSISSSPKPYNYAFSMSKHPLDFSMTHENFEKKEGKSMEKRQSMIKSWSNIIKPCQQDSIQSFAPSTSAWCFLQCRHSNILVSDLFWSVLFFSTHSSLIFFSYRKHGRWPSGPSTRYFVNTKWHLLWHGEPNNLIELK